MVVLSTAGVKWNEMDTSTSKKDGGAPGWLSW